VRTGSGSTGASQRREIATRPERTTSSVARRAGRSQRREHPAHNGPLAPGGAPQLQSARPKSRRVRADDDAVEHASLQTVPNPPVIELKTAPDIPSNRPRAMDYDASWRLLEKRIDDDGGGRGLGPGVAAAVGQAVHRRLGVSDGGDERLWEPGVGQPGLQPDGPDV